MIVGFSLSKLQDLNENYLQVGAFPLGIHLVHLDLWT